MQIWRFDMSRHDTLESIIRRIISIIDDHYMVNPEIYTNEYNHNFLDPFITFDDSNRERGVMLIHGKDVPVIFGDKKFDFGYGVVTIYDE